METLFWPSFICHPILLYIANNNECKPMGQHYLSTLFSPKSVAVFGASDAPTRSGPSCSGTCWKAASRERYTRSIHP